MARIQLPHQSSGESRCIPASHLKLIFVQVGSSRFDSPCGQHVVASAGDAVIARSEGTWQSNACHEGGMVEAMHLPEQHFPLTAQGIGRAGFHLLAGPVSLNSLLSAYLVQLHQHLPTLTPAACAAAWRAADQLLAAAMEQHVARPSEPPELKPEERLHAALLFIQAHLGSPALTPASVAASVHLSTRQLHRIFAGAGLSVAGEIRRLRLARAHSLLLSDRQLAITDVALHCGFESLATFYRLFKAEFAMTASDVRARANGHPAVTRPRHERRARMA